VPDAAGTGDVLFWHGYAVAALPSTEAMVFPSHHGGFLGGEFDQTGKPAEFATKLRSAIG
jgi:hypothetical protein